MRLENDGNCFCTLTGSLVEAEKSHSTALRGRCGLTIDFVVGSHAPVEIGRGKAGLAHGRPAAARPSSITATHVFPVSDAGESIGLSGCQARRLTFEVAGPKAADVTYIASLVDACQKQSDPETQNATANWKLYLRRSYVDALHESITHLQPCSRAAGDGLTDSVPDRNLTLCLPIIE